MSKCFFIYIISLGFSIQVIVGQEVENFTDKFGKFVIKVSNVQSQRYADVMSNVKIDSKKPSLVPSIPPVAVFYRKHEISFTITPKDYFRYTIKNLNEEINTKSYELQYVLKVNRETLIGTTFNPSSFLTRDDRDFNKFREDDFEIISIDKNDRMMICGFDCYKVLVKKRIRMVEMYVTDSISLNYNPAFENPNLSRKFYPLYVKEYLEGFPNDVYKEYVFYKL